MLLPAKPQSESRSKLSRCDIQSIVPNAGAAGTPGGLVLSPGMRNLCHRRGKSIPSSTLAFWPWRCCFSDLFPVTPRLLQMSLPFLSYTSVCVCMPNGFATRGRTRGTEPKKGSSPLPFISKKRLGSYVPRYIPLQIQDVYGLEEMSTSACELSNRSANFAPTSAGAHDKIESHFFFLSFGPTCKS